MAKTTPPSQRDPDKAYAKAQRRIAEAAQTKAEVLNLSGLGLTRLPPEIGQLTALMGLDLNGNQLSSLPPEIGRFTALATLSLHSNQLISLPPEIGQLTALTGLRLHSNQLTSLPPEIVRLTALTELYLHNNQLSSLPPEIVRLTALTRLDLDENQLSSLPPEIGRLTALTTLWVYGNKLSSLPPEIGRLTALTALSLSRNQLSSLPPEIGRLTALTTLDLRGNQLSSLPPEIEQLSRLKRLFLHDNPLLGLPPEILGPTALDVYGKQVTPACPADILAFYFRTHGVAAEATRPLREAKLILVGDGEVGKTALVNLLVDKKRCTGKERQTQGIRIRPWPVRASGKSEIQLNVWDFGGQEIMHATHQFFLTERTLYLVVIDARRGENESRLDYWLKLVQSLGKDSPVIVVANKIDEQRASLDENTIREKYGRNVRDFAYVSCQSGKGAEELREKIRQQVQSLEHVDTLLPASYFAVKEELGRVNLACITYVEYEDICQKHGIDDPEDHRRLIRFLHDLGSMLNFGDDNLAGTNVLRPEWVTEGVYAIITAKRLAENQGVFRRTDLRDLLKAKRYPDPQFIVDVMRKFQLCYPISGAGTPAANDDRWLVPSLLGKDRPKEATLPLGSLRFQYKYRVLPPSIISRFIVATFAQLHKKAPLCWRSGIVLGIEDAKVTVIADAEARTMDVAVTGSDAVGRRSALTFVRTQFQQIHAGMADIEERVPLPERPEVSVPYKWLLAQERAGEHQAVWWDGEANVEVDVDALLNGIEEKEVRMATAEMAAKAPSMGEVFLSYAHKDSKWRDELLTMLAPALRDKTLNLWYDGKIKPSQDWRREIEAAMKRARVGVLLVSRHFLASDFIASEELPFLITAAKKNKVELSWMLLSECLHENQDFTPLQALHEAGKPINAYRGSAREKILKQVAQAILGLAR